MELENLIGEHYLSGVDYCSDGATFVLDGVKYLAMENEDDGYRSYLNDLVVTGRTVTNVFAPVKVFCSMYDDILEMKDMTTGKIVLRIGTDYSDEYYPWCVLEFTPENMSINQSVSDQLYLEEVVTTIVKKYNPNYGDGRLCKCGHSYYRHFDSYEDMYPCGCKYCGCDEFIQETEFLDYVI